MNIPMVVDRSCWHWHLGPCIPGVGRMVLLRAPVAVRLECRSVRRTRWAALGNAALLPGWTTRPRIGQYCWSRGLQSACFLNLAGWRVVHVGRLLGW